MKPKKVINLTMGGFISFFGGLNSLEAQELDKVHSILPKLENIIYVLDSVACGPDSSYWQTPKETFERCSGNCVDLSIYFKDELDKEGIESQLAVGKLERRSKNRHMWIQAFLDGEEYVIECTGGGAIYNKDSLRNLENGPKYIYSNTRTKHITDKVKDYYDRTGDVLDIKGFEPLGKALPLLTSQKF